jgi:hypothetical protein
LFPGHAAGAGGGGEASLTVGLLWARRLIEAVAILGLVAFLYWPARNGVFIWDDTTFLRDQAWLRGDFWKASLFSGVADWDNYFRPLVVLLFAGESRLFAVSPTPMHLVSIGVHLLNTLLVGLLARKLTRDSPFAGGIAMLFFGLHPALIEPVDWIGCQFELLAVFFMLLGLLLNASVQSSRWRATGVALAFLLAAFTKESAACFPLLLGLLDLSSERASSGSHARATLLSIWRRQRAVYLTTLAAGIAYLVLRHWALGDFVIPMRSEQFLSFARAQKICLTYLSYWKLIVWPMSSIAPIHQVDEQLFQSFSIPSLGADMAAFGLLAAGVVAFYRRHPVGTLIMAVSFALLPVLNLIPISFTESLYHDRYAATAIALACALLPTTLKPVWAVLRQHISTRTAAYMLPAVWLAFAVLNIQITVPLWSNETKLWQWALRKDPGSVPVLEHLLSTYMASGDYRQARAIGDQLLLQKSLDGTTLINIANLAIEDGDLSQAASVLNTAKDVIARHPNVRHEARFILALGFLREKRGETAGAEEAYRDAAGLVPIDPDGPMYLALLLARQGRTAEAHEALAKALSLSAPSAQAKVRFLFQEALASDSSQPVVSPEN